MKDRSEDGASEEASVSQTREAVRRDAEDRFLKGYASSAPRSPEPPRSNAVRLLDLFLVEKAAYEICYEAAHRPDWLAVPMRGLVTTLAAIPALRHLLENVASEPAAK